MYKMPVEHHTGYSYLLINNEETIKDIYKNELE